MATETIVTAHAKAMQELGAGAGGVVRASASLSPATRDEYTIMDYEGTRQSERVPRTPRELMVKSNEAYNKVVMVNMAMNLISDLSCEGIRIQHPSKRIEKLYQSWWNLVNGTEVSKMLVLLLYLQANVFIKRGTGVIDEDFLKGLSSDNLFVTAEAGVSLDRFVPKTIKRNEIAWKYTFLNPLTLEVVGEELAPFVGKFVYKMSLPASLVDKLKGKDKAAKDLLNSIDPDFLAEARTGRITLDNDKLRVFHYRKKDWEVWARPMLESIMDDLITFSKLRLADQAACDGATSKLRIWKLGDLDKKILPSKDDRDLFQSFIQYNTGGGPKDIIWTPAIDKIETDTDLNVFLGEDKYRITNRNIRIGLGLPSVFIDDGGSGMTNSFMGVQTLMKRMSYAREVILRFWNEELKLLQKALGHQKPAKIVFDGIDFSEPNAEKQVWIALYDRNLVSIEDVREKLRLDNEVTQSRVAQEFEEMGTDIPHKAGPYYDAQPDLTLKKLQMQLQRTQQQQKAKENTSAGRPGGAKDKKTRKKRLPRQQAALSFEDAYKEVVAAYELIEAHIKMAAPDMSPEDLLDYVFAATYTFSSSHNISVVDAILIANDNFDIVDGVKIKDKDSICTYCTLEKINVTNVPEC